MVFSRLCIFFLEIQLAGESTSFGIFLQKCTKSRLWLPFLTGALSIFLLQPALADEPQKSQGAGFRVQQEGVEKPKAPTLQDRGEAEIKISFHFENYSLEMFNDTLFQVKTKFEKDPFEEELLIVWEPVDPKAFDFGFSDKTAQSLETEKLDEIHFIEE